MENKTIFTDKYELTMAQTYFNEGLQNVTGVFDVFYRVNPFNGGYAIMGGLDNIIEYLKNFKYTSDDVEYLRSEGIYSEEFLDFLKNLRFDGNLFAVPDQIIETVLLSNFNHGTLITTAAKRITNEAKDKPVMEFGARRAPGILSSVEASKYAIIGGCASTSNVLAGKKYNLPTSGTMAHSLVTFYNNEYEAFLSYARNNPNNTVFLVVYQMR